MCVGGIMGCLREQRVFCGQRCVWRAKRGVWERTGVFGCQKGCRRYNGVFEAQMGFFWVFGGEPVCLGVKRGVSV